MHRTALDIDTSSKRSYQTAIRRRLGEPPDQELRAAAMSAARTAAQHVREALGATRVWVFGSLANGLFTPWSDIDLVFQGPASPSLFTVSLHVAQMDDRFTIHLVALDDLPESTQKNLLQQGLEL